MEYTTVYIIHNQKIQKGELRKVIVKIDDNSYHDVEYEAPNIFLYETVEAAKKALQALLHAQMKDLSERLEEL